MGGHCPPKDHPLTTDILKFGDTGLPCVEADVFHTAAGTPYLRSAGVAMISRPHVDLSGVRSFLDHFDTSLEFGAYLDDPTELPPAEQLVKFAGQLCYLSLGPGRSWNDDTPKYLDNIKKSGHGSVAEHAQYSFLVWGIDRSVTHELVRHRAGFGFCLAGDTLVYSERKNQGKRNGPTRRTIREIFEMKSTGHGRSRLKLLRLRCLDESSGTFSTGKVSDVICSGIKPVFKVELSDGKSITCSKDHRFLTPSGWKSLDEMVGGIEISPSGIAVCGHLGTEILTNGIAAYKDKQWLESRYISDGMSQDDIASEAGVSKHTIRSWVRKHGLQKPNGSWTIGAIPWNLGKTYKRDSFITDQQRRTISERMTGKGNHRWRGGITRQAVAIRKPVEFLRPTILRRDEYRCRICGQPSNRLEMHHIIPVSVEPSRVDDPDNIASVCRPCHLEMAGKEMEYCHHFGVQPPDIVRPRHKGRGNLMVPRIRRVVSVTYAGEQMTYDIEMEGYNHNFVANGIVTHNSQVSQRYVDGTKLRFVERPEYQWDRLTAMIDPASMSSRDHEELTAGIVNLHDAFEFCIDRARKDYDGRAEILAHLRKLGHPMLQGGTKTEIRKQVNQVAREGLPNSTEAPIVVSANARAWRHAVEMRANGAADVPIREAFMKIYRCLVHVSPVLFGDYEVVPLPASGTQAVRTETRKI
jgi:thymidylate synthase ThyX/DNA-binding XRE family transcriptional regulator